MLLPLGEWVPILDGDPLAAAVYERHYSAERSLQRRRDRGTLLFVGPGEKLILATPDRSALFAWRRERFRQDGEQGVECAIFRNEGTARSSDLIRAADAIADARWPGARHFTFVHPARTADRRSRSSLPGACFIHADWRPTDRTTTRGLVLLERP